MLIKSGFGDILLGKGMSQYQAGYQTHVSRSGYVREHWYSEKFVTDFQAV